MLIYEYTIKLDGNCDTERGGNGAVALLRFLVKGDTTGNKENADDFKRGWDLAQHHDPDHGGGCW